MANTYVTTQYTEPKYYPEDRLFHNWVRQVDDDGNSLGTVLEFRCPRYEDCPSTINGGITKISWMLFQGLLGASAQPGNWPAAVIGALLAMIEAVFEEPPRSFTGSPVWTDFPHEPPQTTWDPNRYNGGTITIPIP